jgi:MFS family permease
MFSFRSKLFPFWLVPLMIGQVITIAAIPDLINQSLQIILDKQGLPVGLIISAFFLTFTICGLLFGRVTDLYGPKKLLIVFLPALIGTLTLYPLANTAREYVMVRILNAIVYSLVANALIVFMRKSLPDDHYIQARTAGFISASTYLGSGLAMYFGLKLSANVGKLWLTVEIMGLLSAGLIFWSMTLIHPPKQVPMRQKVLMSIRKTASITVREAKRLIDKDAFLITLPGVGISAVYLAFLTYFALYVGGESVATILLLTPVTIGVASITFLPKWVVKRGYLTVMLSSILLLIGSLILIRVSKQQFWLLLLAGMMVGIAFAGGSLSMSEEINRRVHRGALGTGFATYGFLRQIGGVLGTSYSGIMWEIWNANMWLSLIPLLLVALFLLFFLQLKIGENTKIYALECSRYQAAWALAHNLPDSNVQQCLREVRYIESSLVGREKKQVSSPDVLMQRIENIVFAQGLLVGFSIYSPGYRIVKTAKQRHQLDKQLISHLTQMDRENLRDYFSQITSIRWQQETVEEIAKKLKRSGPTPDSAKKAQKFFQAVQVLQVLDTTPPEWFDLAIEKLDTTYAEWIELPAVC